MENLNKQEIKDVIITFYINVDGMKASVAKRSLTDLIERYKDFGKDSNMRVHQIWLPVKNQSTEVKIQVV